MPLGLRLNLLKPNKMNSQRVMTGIICLLLFMQFGYSQSVSIDVTEEPDYFKIEKLPGKKAIDISIGRKGKVFIVDTQNILYYYDKWKRNWVSLGMDKVTDVAADHNGNPWVVRTNGSLSWYSIKRKEWKELRRDVEAVFIGKDERGTTLVINSKNGNLEEWNRKERQWQTHPLSNAKRWSGAKDIAISPKGEIYLIPPKYDLIQKYDPKKNNLDLVPDSWGAQAIDFSTDGSFYAIQKGMVKRRYGNSFKEHGKEQVVKKQDVTASAYGMPWMISESGEIYVGRGGTVELGYLPSKDGYRFPNAFNTKQKIEVATTSFTPKMAFDLSTGYGLCGGMALSSRDVYRSGSGIPETDEIPNPGSQLYNHLLAKLYTSFGKNDKYLYKSVTWWAHPSGKDELPKKSKEEYRALKSKLDKEGLAMLYLTYYTETDNYAWQNHQVLAYGYTTGLMYDVIHIYDPNFPNNNTQVIKVEFKNGGVILQQEGWRHYLNSTSTYKDKKEIHGIFPADI